MPSMGRLVLLVSLGLAYFAAGRFGLSLAFVNQSASAVWPATGIALAACLLAGPWVWPAIFVGSVAVNLTTTGAFGPSLLIGAGNTAEALAATWLVRRLAGGLSSFENTGRILLYAAATAAAAAVGAGVGLIALLWGGLAGRSDPSLTWLTWWTGDLSGALLVTPLIVTWARPGALADIWPVRRAMEALLLLCVVSAAAYLVYGPTPAGARSYPLMFVVLPVLLWAALRFGPRGATLAVMAITIVATAGTLEGFGPFARETPNESLLLLQAYLGVTIVAMLSLAAEVEARRAAQREMKALNEDLARRVDARTEELQRLHGRLVEAQSVAHIGSWDWDMLTDTVWWSDELYRLYGLPVGSPIGYERYISLVHPDDRALVQAIVGRSAESGEPFAFDHRLVSSEGIVRTMHSQGRVITDDRGRPVRMLGIGHDITEHKRAEEERLELVREQAARREAEEASRLKDQFLATLSHELRTPLNAILGWARLLEDHATDENVRSKAIDRIQRNVHVQAQLVSDIMDVVRIRSGSLSIDPRPVFARAIVESALEMLRPAMEAKRIDVGLAVPDDMAVMGDPQRLQQVFWNVLANAAKFVQPGGCIAITAAPDAGALQFTIEDNGPGIAEEFLPHVFEPFKQADSTLTREHGGLGLGLAISRNLVQLHGGAMTAANRPQGGAIFTVRVPAATIVQR